MTRDDDDIIPLVPENAKKRGVRAPKPSTKKARLCPGCGYDLRGQKPGTRCPECGARTGDPRRQRGGVLLLHAGRQTVLALLWLLVPVAALALLALALLLLGTIGVVLDDRLVFAIPAMAVPLGSLGLVLTSPRFTRPEEIEDRTAQRSRIAVAVGAILWLVHAAILAKLFVELRKPTPLTSAQDVVYTCAVAFAMVIASIYFVGTAARLRSLERWITGDNEGSLFMGVSGVVVYAPVLVVGLVHAMLILLQRPVVRAAWRIDRLVIFLATLDVAWRTLRAVRLSMHSLRHATETQGREDRLEELREEHFDGVVRRQR